MRLHILLKQYRALYIIITGFFLWLGWDAWDWFKLNHESLSEAAAAGFITIYIAVIGALKYALENSRQDSTHDESD
jgi:TRAP-type C4-dicarboxylate transport system permease small subunit